MKKKIIGRIGVCDFEGIRYAILPNNKIIIRSFSFLSPSRICHGCNQTICFLKLDSIFINLQLNEDFLNIVEFYLSNTYLKHRLRFKRSDNL